MNLNIGEILMKQLDIIQEIASVQEAAKKMKEKNNPQKE
jgi:hypothetical protein